MQRNIFFFYNSFSGNSVWGYKSENLFLEQKTINLLDKRETFEYHKKKYFKTTKIFHLIAQ
jgi:hypothetical protein